MASEKGSFYSIAKALTRMELRKNDLRFNKNETIYSQGDDANNVFYLEQGRVKITVVSRIEKKRSSHCWAKITSSAKGA